MTSPTATGGSEASDVLEPLSADVETFAALRVLSGDRGRAYGATWAGPKWAAHLFRMAEAFGYVAPSKGPGEEYALLDVLDSNGDFVQHYAIPTAAAFRWWYRKLGLRVTSEDGQPLPSATPRPAVSS